MTTASDWLLERFDVAADDPGRKPTNHERPAFELIDDTHRDDCTGRTVCRRTSGDARWPEPNMCDDMDEYDAMHAFILRSAA